MNGESAVRKPAEVTAGRPLQVLFMHDHLGHAEGRIHGVTTYFLETLPAFDRTRVAPRLCILRPHHAAAERFEGASIRPLFLGRTKWDPGALADIIGLLRHQKVDLLHVSGEKSLLLGRFAARLMGLPVVAHFHDSLPAPAVVRQLQRRLAPGTARALAVSEPIRKYMAREFGFPDTRTQVLHNGLRAERFARASSDARPRLRAELGLAPDAPVVGVVGRVHRDKGQRAMIRAMARVLERCPEAALVIVGDGPDRESCIVLAVELGLEKQVRFIGQRDDVPDVLGALDVVVVPSLWEEPFPFVPLEAMAAGKPVVAFRIGGLPESIVHGETGLLVPHADEAGLADAVGELLTRPELARRFGEGGAQRVKEFTVERHVRHLEALYGDIVGAPLARTA